MIISTPKIYIFYTLFARFLVCVFHMISHTQDSYSEIHHHADKICCVWILSSLSLSLFLLVSVFFFKCHFITIACSVSFDPGYSLSSFCVCRFWFRNRIFLAQKKEETSTHTEQHENFVFYFRILRSLFLSLSVHFSGHYLPLTISFFLFVQLDDFAAC